MEEQKQSQPPAWFTFVVIIGVVVAFVAVADGCTKDAKAERDTCIDNGMTYYKEIGSYPVLKSFPNAGRVTKDVVLEECAKNINTFD